MSCYTWIIAVTKTRSLLCIIIDILIMLCKCMYYNICLYRQVKSSRTVYRLLMIILFFLHVQVSTDSRASEYLAFLQSILSPFLESYWHTALALLQMDKDTEGNIIWLCLSLQSSARLFQLSLVIFIFLTSTPASSLLLWLCYIIFLAAELMFLRQLHANLVEKAEKGLLSNGNQWF